MAITFSASSQGTTLAPAGVTTQVTSPSFTPNATGCILIVKAGTWDTVLSPLPALPTNTGPTLTWHQIAASAVTNASPGKIWWAWCPGNTAMTVSIGVANTAASSTGYAAIAVERWYGSNLAVAPVFVVSGGDATSPYTTTLTTTGANSVISWAGFDWNGTATASPTYVSPAAQTAAGYHVAGAFSAFFANQTVATPAATTFGETAPAGQKTTLVAVEILQQATKIDTLTEQFTTSPAPAFPTTYGSPTVTNGVLRIPATRTSGATDYRGAQTASSYSLLESSVFVKPVTIPPYLDSTLDVVTEMQFGSSAGGMSSGNFSVFELHRVSSTQTNLVMKMNVGYNDGAAVTLTYDPVAMLYLRFRVTSSVFYWETSPDGTTWTVRRQTSTVPEWAIYPDCKLVLQAEKLSGTDNTGYAEWDNVNVVYTPVTRQLVGNDLAVSTDGATLRRTTVQFTGIDTSVSTDTGTIVDRKPGQLSGGDPSVSTTVGVMNRIRRFGNLVTDASVSTDSTARSIAARKLTKTDAGVSTTVGARVAIRNLQRTDADLSTTQNIPTKNISDARPLRFTDQSVSTTIFTGTYLHVGGISGLSRGTSRTFAVRLDIDITQRQVFGTAYHERYREAGRGIKGPEVTGIDPGVLSRYVVAGRERFGSTP